MLTARARECARLRARGISWQRCARALCTSKQALHAYRTSEEWQRYLAECERHLEWQLVTHALSPLVTERRRRVAVTERD